MTPSTAPTASRDHTDAPQPRQLSGAGRSNGQLRESSDPLTSFRLRTASGQAVHAPVLNCLRNSA